MLLLKILHFISVENLALFIYNNPLICDERIYWMKVGESQSWLRVVVGQCQNFPNSDWDDITLPQPAGPRN